MHLHSQNTIQVFEACGKFVAVVINRGKKHDAHAIIAA